MFNQLSLKQSKCYLFLHEYSLKLSAQRKTQHKEIAMLSEETVLIEFTDSEPPRIKSHENWNRVYDLISQTHDCHPDPYYLQSENKTVVLMNDGNGIVRASLISTEKAHVLYNLSGGVWIELMNRE